jgi:hypothetical protein
VLVIWRSDVAIMATGDFDFLNDRGFKCRSLRFIQICNDESK